jgi:hypothetical protein
VSLCARCPYQSWLWCHFASSFSCLFYRKICVNLSDLDLLFICCVLIEKNSQIWKIVYLNLVVLIITFVTNCEVWIGPNPNSFQPCTWYFCSKNLFSPFESSPLTYCSAIVGSSPGATFNLNIKQEAPSSCLSASPVQNTKSSLSQPIPIAIVSIPVWAGLFKTAFALSWR